jgi:hypothetical protein
MGKAELRESRCQSVSKQADLLRVGSQIIFNADLVGQASRGPILAVLIGADPALAPKAAARSWPFTPLRHKSPGQSWALPQPRPTTKSAARLSRQGGSIEQQAQLGAPL